MFITASWGCEDVAVEVGAECQTLAALKALLQDALPALDVEKLCLQIGGRAASDEAVCALEEGAVVTLSATLAAQAVTALIDEGVSVGVSGFCRAAESGNVRQCKLFLETDVSTSLVRGMALHSACFNGHLEVCKLLIDTDRAVLHADHNGSTPFFVACSSHTRAQLEICKLLVDRGCSLDAQNIFGRTPLHIVCLKGNMELCELILSNGGGIDVEDRESRTPLHVAATLGYAALCTLLLDHGFSMAARDFTDRTPLHSACAAGHLDVVKVLIDRGCSPQQKGPSDMTPAQIASVNDQKEVHDFLLALESD
eukprot:Rhum_TRINITY_DN14882_c0_g2::Rhum_TRINITY_DN14882_c0_g2_i9::g.124159::m.124159